MGVILSNNRIKGDLFLNQSCVSGLVLESMLLMDTLQNSFPQTVRPSFQAVYDCSRPHFAQTNISLSKSRVRLADSICLSSNSPLQRLQRDEGGGWTRVRI